MLEIQPIKTTSIVLPIKTTNHTSPIATNEKEDFHKARNGKWSGTVVKRLMACNSKGGRLSWADEEKALCFSNSVKSLIYERYKMRVTGKYIESKGTKEMQYGTRVEPLILAIGRELIRDWLLKENPSYKAKNITTEPVKFKSFDDIPNAGATSDSVTRYIDEVIATTEAKACTTWTTHFKRCFDPMDEKDIDFWQTQTQMISWNVDKCFYLVAEPPKDFGKYLYYDGDIMDLLEEFKNECTVTLQVVKQSLFHQLAIKRRIIFAEKVVNALIDSNSSKVEDVYTELLDEEKGIIYELPTQETEHAEPDIEQIQVIDHIEVEPIKGELLHDGFEELEKHKVKDFLTPKDLETIKELPNDLPF